MTPRAVARIPAWLWIAALAALPYLAVLGGPFQFDDHSMLRLTAVSTPDGWTRLLRIDESRPLTILSFWANFQVAGQRSPMLWHAVNLLLHVANSILAWRVLAAWVAPSRAALAAACIFAAHPLQAEPVCYIFARSTLLAAFFCLTALLLWNRASRWWAAIAFALALLSKEECVAFPLFLLLLNWAQRRTRAEWPAIGAMLALSAAAGLRVLHATSSIAGSGAGFGATQTPWTYFTAQGVAILRYLRLLIVPYPLTVDPQIDATPLAAGVAWLAVAAAIALAIRFARSFEPAMWFLGGLLLLAPSSSFLPADDLAADRRLYLPMLAFAACLALLAERLPWKRASLAFVAMLCGLLVWQVHHWTSETLLWQQAVVAHRLTVGRSLPSR